jgi:triosephosphate isomerase (TIM)
MRRFLIAANWKMQGDRESNAALAGSLKNALGSCRDVDLVIAAPFVYLDQLHQQLATSNIKLAAQNVSEYDEGAYTGEISARMLADMFCAYGIVGHSERRILFHECDEVVVKKFVKLQAQGITPVLCVGETLAQRQAGQTDAIVSAQLNALISTQGVSVLENAVLAYEPVWAIGTGKTATPEQAQAVHKMLRALVATYDKHLAEKLRIIYGGSVNEGNAAELFAQADIDGGLVGGASLDANNFINICKVVWNG